jgi:hypothetical protein
MNNKIFNIVATFLSNIGRITGRSYNEINIIVYFFLIPFSWFVLLDLIFKLHYFKIVFAIYTLCFALYCRNFKKFSDWMFNKSVIFLNYFNKYGSNYVVTSVLVCVTLPILIYTMLILLVLKY